MFWTDSDTEICRKAEGKKPKAKIDLAYSATTYGRTNVLHGNGVSRSWERWTVLPPYSSSSPFSQCNGQSATGRNAIVFTRLWSFAYVMVGRPDIVNASRKSVWRSDQAFFSKVWAAEKSSFASFPLKKHNLALSILAQVSNRASLEQEPPVEDLEEEEEEECLSTLTREGSGENLARGLSPFLSALLSPSLARNMRTGGPFSFSLSRYLSFPIPVPPSAQTDTCSLSQIVQHSPFLTKKTFIIKSARVYVWQIRVQSLFPGP